jgi:hypothetical protein
MKCFLPVLYQYPVWISILSHARYSYKPCQSVPPWLYYSDHKITDNIIVIIVIHIIKKTPWF